MNKKMERESKVANKVRNVESGRPEIIWVGQLPLDLGFESHDSTI